MAVTKQILGALAPWCMALEVSAGAVIFRRVRGGGIQYLMIQYRHGHWEFPRGHQEEGETIEQTARREIAEETGLTSVRMMPDFMEKMSFSYTAKGDERAERVSQKRCIFIHKKVIFYLAETHGQEVKLSHEHQNYAWLPYRAALAKLTFDNGRRIITAADEYLKSK